MNALRIYRVTDHYIAFLHSRDSRVQFNKQTSRPYVGVVLHVGEFKYFVPMESPKPHHKKIKPGTHILKMDDGRLGLLGFNNMIPVRDDVLITFDIAEEPDADYSALLQNKHTFAIETKAKFSAKQHGHTMMLSTEKTNFLRQSAATLKNSKRPDKQFDLNR